MRTKVYLWLSWKINRKYLFLLCVYNFRYDIYSVSAMTNGSFQNQKYFFEFLKKVKNIQCIKQRLLEIGGTRMALWSTVNNVIEIILKTVYIC